jgi:hypothetical protein
MCGAEMNSLVCDECGTRYGHKSPKKRKFDDGFHFSEKEIDRLRSH